MLSGHDFTSKDLWHHVKPLVRMHETEDACLIIDDTLIGKPYMDENDIICWHWDHSKGRNEKGINLLTAFYHSQALNTSEALRIPISYECVKKTIRYCEIKTRREKRQSPVSKNEMMRSMISRAVEKQHPVFKNVLADSWFSSSDNLLFIHKLKKYFLMDMKSNRQCMFATSDRNKGQWSSLDKLSLTPEHPVQVWLKDMEIPVHLCKLVYTNRDGSTGEMYLVSNNLELSTEEIKTLYKKRWSVEEYHKSLKQNASLSKSPARTVTTQSNHLFASLLAYVKLEKLKFAHKLNHFALNARIYLATSKAAWNELYNIKYAMGA
jgi:hypothetical protein